jgi:hypothetical protein
MKALLIILFTSLGFLLSCQPEQKSMTLEQIKLEETEIIKVIEANNKASEEKNFAELLKTLADSVSFFGTDQNEVIKTFADYKVAIQKQWESYEYTKFSKIQDVFITMDKNASVASIIYGVQLEAKFNGNIESLFLRVSRNMVKQDGKWVIASGITSIPRQAPPKSVIDSTIPNQ